MKELENKLQFVILLALFFPSLLTSLFDDKTAKDLTLKWAVVIILLILNYCYLKLLKPDLTKKIISILDALLDINVFFYIFLICSFTPLMKFPIVIKILSLLGTLGVILIPIAILLILISFTVYISNHKFFNKIKG